MMEIGGRKIGKKNTIFFCLVGEKTEWKKNGVGKVFLS